MAMESDPKIGKSQELSFKNIIKLKKDEFIILLVKGKGQS